MFVAACAVCTTHPDVLPDLPVQSVLLDLFAACAMCTSRDDDDDDDGDDAWRNSERDLLFIFLKTYHCVYFYTRLFLDTWIDLPETDHSLVIMAESKGQRGQSSGSTSGPLALRVCENTHTMVKWLILLLRELWTTFGLTNQQRYGNSYVTINLGSVHSVWVRIVEQYFPNSVHPNTPPPYVYCSW